MGCSCIGSNKYEITSGDSKLYGFDPDYIADLGTDFLFLLIEKRINSDPKMKQLFLRIQARFRGIITRNKVKGGSDINCGFNNAKFVPRDPYGTYTTIATSRIVIYL